MTAQKVQNTLSRLSTISEITKSESYASSLGILELICAFFDEPASLLFKRMVSIILAPKPIL